MTTNQTTPVTNLDALTQAVNAQREAAHAGLGEIMRIASDGMDSYQDMDSPALQEAFSAIHEAACTAGERIEALAVSVGCEDCPTEQFQSTATDPESKAAQEAANDFDVHFKESAGKIMGVAGMAITAIEGFPSVAQAADDTLAAVEHIRSANATFDDLHGGTGLVTAASQLAKARHETDGLKKVAPNLWAVFQTIHHLARDTENLLEGIAA